MKASTRIVSAPAATMELATCRRPGSQRLPTNGRRASAAISGIIGSTPAVISTAV